MKKLKRIIALTFAFVMVLALVSCSGIDSERNERIKAQCETIIDAMIAEDAEAAYAVFTTELDKTSFIAGFTELCEYIDGVETYELRQNGWYTGIDNGISYYRLTFAMTTNAGNFQIEAMEVEGYEGLYHFRIIAEEELNPSYTGTITTLAGANFLQWGILIFSALCWGFTVWMLVDCCKRKIKYKPLWIVIILAGALVFTLESNMSINISIAAMIFAYSYLKIYSTGACVLKLVLPIGAVAYLLLRKKFILSTQPAADKASSAEPQAPANDTEAEVKGETEENKPEE